MQEEIKTYTQELEKLKQTKAAAYQALLKEQEVKENKDNDFYIKHFNEEVLSNITVTEFLEDIKKWLSSVATDIVRTEELSLTQQFIHMNLQPLNWKKKKKRSGKK